ncbi:MAG TPA: MATE family efflux transporter, partial [Candidatus Ruthenibacterium merdigallinarum]|nr:MATE family efflux transporter [Candidatus Ruthenibacterium merdigallinarum]
TMIYHMSPFYCTFVLVEILSGAIRGCGDALRPMLITGSGICLLRVIWLLVLLPLRHELTTILYSYPISWALTSALFLVYYRRGHWMRPQSALQQAAAREQSDAG